MKAKITRPDGTTVEVEGLTDDVVRAVRALSPAPWPQSQPLVFPTPWRIDQPWAPSPTITWSESYVTPEPA